MLWTVGVICLTASFWLFLFGQALAGIVVWERIQDQRSRADESDTDEPG